MRDTELYRQLLGLAAPWSVAKVELNTAGGRVDVWVEHKAKARFACPQCRKQAPLHDHAAERTWRHLDTCQFQTLIHARAPRVRCPEHGVLQVELPWAEPHGRFTCLMERLIIDVLLQCQTVIGACRLLGLSWDEAAGVMRRAVARGLVRKGPRVLRQLGIDEKAHKRGHRYVTVVCDIERSCVEHVVEDRRTASLDAFWKSLTEEQLQGIEAVAMDMWQPYFRSTLTHVPDAEKKIVFDRFHIMQHAGRAVDQVLRAEHKALMGTGDARLKGARHMVRYSQENVPEKYRERMGELRASNLKVSKAWVYRELLRALWDYRDPQRARLFFQAWFARATRSRIGPVQKFAHLVKRHLENILTYCRHQLTNAVAEGLNSKIMAIKRRAGGYRSLAGFKTAIYFHCGGLDLYPR